MIFDQSQVKSSGLFVFWRQLPGSPIFLEKRVETSRHPMYASTSLSNTPTEHDPWKHSQTETARFSAADFPSSTPRSAAHATANEVQIQLIAGTNAQPELEGHKQASFFVTVVASAFPPPQ